MAMSSKLPSLSYSPGEVRAVLLWLSLVVAVDGKGTAFLLSITPQRRSLLSKSGRSPLARGERQAEF